MSDTNKPAPPEPAAETVMDLFQDHEGPVEALDYLPIGTKLYTADQLRTAIEAAVAAALASQAEKHTAELAKLRQGEARAVRVLRPNEKRNVMSTNPDIPNPELPEPDFWHNGPFGLSVIGYYSEATVLAAIEAAVAAALASLSEPAPSVPAVPEFCCEHAWSAAKQLAWKERDLICDCDHNEYCQKCFPLEFRAGGKWDKYIAAPVASKGQPT